MYVLAYLFSPGSGGIHGKITFFSYVFLFFSFFASRCIPYIVGRHSFPLHWTIFETLSGGSQRQSEEMKIIYSSEWESDPQRRCAFLLIYLKENVIEKRSVVLENAMP